MEYSFRGLRPGRGKTLVSGRGKIAPAMSVGTKTRAACSSRGKSILSTCLVASLFSFIVAVKKHVIWRQSSFQGTAERIVFFRNISPKKGTLPGSRYVVVGGERDLGLRRRNRRRRNHGRRRDPLTGAGRQRGREGGKKGVSASATSSLES